MYDKGLQAFWNGTNSTCCFFDEPLLSYLLPPLLIVVFVMGSSFNGIALWVFCCQIKSWTSSTVYLFNLAVADFLLLICLPFRTDYYLKQKTWVYGEIPCWLVLFMLAMNRSGSIFFLTLIGIDRYCRVVHPHHSINSMPTKFGIGIACAVWVGSVVLTIFVVPSIQNGGEDTAFCDFFTICPSYFDYYDLHFIMVFFLPLCIILYCSCRIVWRLRQRNLDRHFKIKRAVQCIILVGIMFSVFFLPSVSTRIEVLRLLSSPQKADCNIYKTVDTAFYITITLTYMNSMCNPLVYYFFSPSFQAFYLKIIKCSNQSEMESEQNNNNSHTTPELHTAASPH
ncbi:hydroxycarboxylic acid receptor 2 [Spea bombifrons]|uniref:hydroxycarboxylic acid receptor 2 n=1 Tax=Spea bombifrons TaxID=233779 RepID=UPI00234B8507|nr:hydroxycarboxylic acid receptor 2 [Spea bombifrons]